MSLRVFLRVLFAGLLGALLVVTVGAALQFNEIATMMHDAIEPDARVLEVVAELQRLLGATDRGSDFEREFREQLARIQPATVESTAAAERVEEAFASWIELRDRSQAERVEAELRSAVAALGTEAGEQEAIAVESIHVSARAAALGLSILGAAALLVGAWVLRSLRQSLLDRLSALDVAITAVDRGDRRRRVSVGGTDELARMSAAFDRMLDERDQAEALAQGRGSELRAVLVALLRDRSRPAAVTGIDGEIIVSTLSAAQEEALRSITPQVRKAARTLLSRGFASAAELTTRIQVDRTHALEILALAAGERRVVGWLAIFEEPAKT